MRAAGQRLDVQGLRVLPVHSVAHAAQHGELAQPLRVRFLAGHPSISRSASTVFQLRAVASTPSRVNAEAGIRGLDAPSA